MERAGSAHSHVWRYRRGAHQVIGALDYPFKAGWRRLYQGSGWNVLGRCVLPFEDSDASNELDAPWNEA